MNSQDIPTPSDIANEGEFVVGTQAHKSWLLDVSLRFIVEYMARDEVRTEIKTRIAHDYFPCPLPIRCDNGKYDLSYIIDGLKTIMSLRGWTIQLAKPTYMNVRYDRPTIFMWPSDLRPSGPWYESIMLNSIEQKQPNSIQT